MSSFLSATKTGFARATQQAKVALGRAESSVDGPYDQKIADFKTARDAAKKLQKDSQKLLDNLRDFGLAQASIADGFLNALENYEGPEHAQVEHSREALRAIEAARISLDEQLRKDVLEPMMRNLGRFDELDGRIKAGGNQRVDMDRYTEEARQMRNKNPNDPKLVTLEQKLKVATDSYHAYRDPLINDIAQLIDDRVYVAPCAASYLSALAEYYRLSAEATAPFVGRARAASQSKPAVVPVLSAAVPHVTPSSQLSPRGSLPPAPVSPRPTSLPQVPKPVVVATPVVAAAPAIVRPPPPLPKKSGPQARGLFDFTAGEPGELSFKAGDILDVHTQNGDWWEASLNGHKGTVPHNYIQLL